MKDQDRERFRANIHWFNQFFDGVRDIYEMVGDQLPVEYFPAATISSENFYFPRQKNVPSIPPFYAFLFEGFKHGLQIITVIDANLIARNSGFIREPSIIIVVHTQPDKNSWLDEFAMDVVRHNKVEILEKDRGIIWGCFKGKYMAQYFSFQVGLDKFSGVENPQQAVRQYIMAPLLENMRKGFPDLPD